MEGNMENAIKARDKFKDYLQKHFHNVQTGGKQLLPATKKDWNKVLVKKEEHLNNVDDGACLAGELYTKFKSCYSWLEFVTNEYDTLQKEKEKLKTEKEKLHKDTESNLDYTSLAELKEQIMKLQETSDTTAETLNDVKESLAVSSKTNTTISETVDQLKAKVMSTSNVTALEDVVPDIIEKAVNMAETKWTDLFKSNKEELKKQTQEARNQSKLVEKSILANKQKQAVENIERQKRLRNVILRNVPESTKTNVTDCDQYDKNYVMTCLELQSDDITTVYRVGEKKEAKGPRVLVAVLTTPELARKQHNYGRGRPIFDGNRVKHWVNPDLIKEDRIANYKAREHRRGLQAKKVEGNQHLQNQTENFRK